jgi:hypothetical protein
VISAPDGNVPGGTASRTVKVGGVEIEVEWVALLGRHVDDPLFTLLERDRNTRIRRKRDAITVPLAEGHGQIHQENASAEHDRTCSRLVANDDAPKVPSETA